jgi:hypothetical protein
MGNAENPATGAKFETVVRDFFSRQGLALQPDFPVEVGFTPPLKRHNFDLGCADQPTLIECKCHTWTEGGNAPSAKLAVWNEAMFYFTATPHQYRKILAVLRHFRGAETLAEHYLKRFRHLVPIGVEIWEIAADGQSGRFVHPSKPNGEYTF